MLYARIFLATLMSTPATGLNQISIAFHREPPRATTSTTMW